MDSVERKELLETSGDRAWPEESQVLSRLLARRYSSRAYKPEPVERAVIERMFAIAQMSSSWCNSQPWQVHVTEGEGTERFRKTLYEKAMSQAAAGDFDFAPDFAFPAAYRGIYKQRQREVGWQLYESVGIAYGDRVASGKQVLENFRLFGAPHALVITTERDLGVYGAIDCGLYICSLQLAAESLGIGMIPQAALASFAPLVREFFNLPDNRIVVVGASFGYPDVSHPANSFRSRRAPVAQAVEWVSA
jgi:nitroreductase